MKDTVKMVLKMDKPLSCRAAFQTPIDSIKPDFYGYFKTVRNPTAHERRNGIYRPRLTYTQRPRGYKRAAYELMIELSLPKIVYGNNFDELVQADFGLVVKKIQESLKEMGIWVFTKTIEEADIRSVHYSKNITFIDYTSASSILKMLSGADISRRYDTSANGFRNGGQVFHVHTNSLDIAAYDKLADLRQARISEKRAIESDNYVQTSLLDLWKRQEPLAVLRFEVRLGSRKKIKDSLAQIEYDDDLTFKKLFNEDLSQRLLLNHWNTFFGNIKKLEVDDSSPEAYLANVLVADDLKGPQDAAARWAFALASETADMRQVRNQLEDRFGSHAWSRVKALNNQPNKVQYKSLLEVDKQLKQFKPTRLNDISKHI